MSNKMDILLETSNEFIEVAKQMLQSCQLKRHKISSYSRFAISFFFRRAWEMFESFIILIKENRLVDGAILLRSLCNMAIDLAYIVKDEKTKEIRAIKYLLSGDKAQKKLLNSNIDEFRKYYEDLDDRLDELKSNIKIIEDELTKKCKERKWDLPPIAKRAKEAGPLIANYYNQVYRYYSNVEHHNYIFGQAYVDTDNCEPFKKPEKIDKSTFFRPDIMLFMFRGLFSEILKAFNEEFQLKWEDKITEMTKEHDGEYELLRE